MPDRPADPSKTSPTCPTSRGARWQASFRELGAVLRAPGVAPAALASFLARLPKGAIPLALVLLGRSQSGSLAVAGIAAGLFALGDALSAPALGRALDRLGRTETVLGCTAVHLAAVGGAALGRGHPVPFCAAATVAGFALPPVGGAAKAAWAQLLPTERHHAAYTMESLLQQSFFLAGPLLVTAAITSFDSVVAGLLVTLAVSSSGVVAFVIATRRLGRTRGPGKAIDRPPRRVLLHGSVPVMSLATLAEGVAFGGFGVCAVALSVRAGSSTTAGILQALLTGGGLLGAVTASRTVGRRRFAGLLAGFAAVGAALAGLAALQVPLVVIGGVLLVQGVFLTPIAASSYRLVAADTTDRIRAEAFGWLSTALAVGNAGGAAAGGWLADHAGPGLGLLLGPVAVMAAAVGCWISARDGRRS